MKAKNQIVSGFLEGFHFTKKYGKLYLKCLECEYSVNKMTVRSIQVLNCRHFPSLSNSFLRGFIFSKFFSILGMLVGVVTARKNSIYTVKLTFTNNEVGLAEIDAKNYDYLINELFDIK